MSSVIATASHQSRTENTPARLRRLIVINWIIAAIVCAVTMIGYGEHRHAVQTVGSRRRTIGGASAQDQECRSQRRCRHR